MGETIHIDVPRRGIGSDLTEALAAHGLSAEVVDTEERCELRVRFAANEHDRLVEQAVAAIESYLADRMLPLVVQRVDGAAIVRPPGD
ncbi:MAG TPA: hypothetical protein VGQ38_02415 [Gaiellaceae bacterium]|jgi:hypothetical protein|nr:hypothetical protein [Gaiellaceae bacterium]